MLGRSPIDSAGSSGSGLAVNASLSVEFIGSGRGHKTREKRQTERQNQPEQNLEPQNQNLMVA